MCHNCRIFVIIIGIMFLRNFSSFHCLLRLLIAVPVKLDMTSFCTQPTWTCVSNKSVSQEKNICCSLAVNWSIFVMNLLTDVHCITKLRWPHGNFQPVLKLFTGCLRVRTRGTRDQRDTELLTSWLYWFLGKVCFLLSVVITFEVIGWILLMSCH
jgi:hypothetical protein